MGGHFGTTAFREGEIFVVMSMDPFDQVDRAGWERFEKEAARFEASLERISKDDFKALMGLLEEKNKLEEQARRLSTKRRIVNHPSLFGRELAWSVARVDFWFNNREGLSKEAALINGGSAMPSEFMQIPIDKAETWQFYERDGSIRIANGSGKIGKLIVQSDKAGDAAARSHYAVSMFVFDKDSELTGEGKSLPELEKQLQPMLDWLAVNHHDFIRLNDFSESLMLLRWLKANSIAPMIVDFQGEPPEIATPDQVVIGEGPKLSGSSQ